MNGLSGTVSWPSPLPAVSGDTTVSPSTVYRHCGFWFIAAAGRSVLPAPFSAGQKTGNWPATSGKPEMAVSGDGRRPASFRQKDCRGGMEKKAGA